MVQDAATLDKLLPTLAGSQAGQAAAAAARPLGFVVLLWGEPSEAAVATLGPRLHSFDAVLARGAEQVGGRCPSVHMRSSLPLLLCCHLGYASRRPQPSSAISRIPIPSWPANRVCSTCAQAFYPSELTGADLATLVYTSGTTGSPKASSLLLAAAAAALLWGTGR